MNPFHPLKGPVHLPENQELNKRKTHVTTAWLEISEWGPLSDLREKTHQHSSLVIWSNSTVFSEPKVQQSLAVQTQLSSVKFRHYYSICVQLKQKKNIFQRMNTLNTMHRCTPQLSQNISFWIGAKMALKTMQFGSLHWRSGSCFTTVHNKMQG